MTTMKFKVVTLVKRFRITIGT